jgi:type IV secretory pathway VirB2 component (pilin)
MRESLQRRSGPWLSNGPRRQRSTERLDRSRIAKVWSAHRERIRLTATTMLTAVLLFQTALSAQQSPWERAAGNLERTFTGPLARSLALVAIVIGGLMFMFGEGGAKRQISGIVFGGGLTLFAAQFLTWLF